MSIVDTLEGGYLEVCGNGFSGHTNLHRGISFTQHADGSYTFTTYLQMEGEPNDQITGTIKGRHITFTRNRPGAFVQEYDGWVFEKQDTHKQVEMAGMFSHNGTKAYGWYGLALGVLPR